MPESGSWPSPRPQLPGSAMVSFEFSKDSGSPGANLALAPQPPRQEVAQLALGRGEVLSTTGSTLGPDGA